MSVLTVCSPGHFEQSTDWQLASAKHSLSLHCAPELCRQDLLVLHRLDLKLIHFCTLSCPMLVRVRHCQELAERNCATDSATEPLTLTFYRDRPSPASHAETHRVLDYGPTSLYYIPNLIARPQPILMPELLSTNNDLVLTCCNYTDHLNFRWGPITESTTDTSRLVFSHTFANGALVHFHVCNVDPSEPLLQASRPRLRSSVSR